MSETGADLEQPADEPSVDDPTPRSLTESEVEQPATVASWPRWLRELRDRVRTWPGVLSIAILMTVIGSWAPWSVDGPVRLGGLEGSHDGWLAALYALDGAGRRQATGASILARHRSDADLRAGGAAVHARRRATSRIRPRVGLVADADRWSGDRHGERRHRDRPSTRRNRAAMGLVDLLVATCGIGRARDRERRRGAPGLPPGAVRP